MKLKLNLTVHPYTDLAGDTLWSSDWHLGHFEVDRVARNGVKPVDVLRAFSAARLHMDNPYDIVVVGDMIDSAHRGPESLLQLDRELWPIMVVAGNHDARWTGVDLLHYEWGDIAVSERCAGAHGHQAHAFWEGRHPARQWIREQIYRAGYNIQTVHPKLDTVVLGIGKRIGDLLVRPGRKLGMKKMLTWAIETAADFAPLGSWPGCTLITGHTHYPGYWRMCRTTTAGSSGDPLQYTPTHALHKWRSTRSLLYDRHGYPMRLWHHQYEVDAWTPREWSGQIVYVYNTGSAIPYSDDHPDGLYCRGECYPFAFSEKLHVLIRLELDGYRIIEEVM